ncbi:MAG: L-threonine 3-dehydrogenase [Alphaproteobacteria bacterium]
MRALVKDGPRPGLVMREEPQPQPGGDEILVRVRRASICGTDLHIWNWDEWAAKTIPTPLIIGHEWSGEVVACGERAGGIEIGQRVSGEGHITGRVSRMSRAGRRHLDPETRGIGVNLPGAFAEYLRLPAFNAVALSDLVSDEVGAILDPFGNAVHAALSFDLVGEDVLITGAGPIGIMAAMVARRVGARHIVITDINPYRLALAGRLVDAVAVNVVEESLAEVAQKIGMREGFDIGLEMSGAAAALPQMIEAMIMGGRIALVGIPPQPFAVDWTKIIFKALSIKAIYGREIFETWYKAIALIESGLDISAIITHHLEAEEFEAAFALVRSGECGKVVLNWSS